MNLLGTSFVMSIFQYKSSYNINFNKKKKLHKKTLPTFDGEKKEERRQLEHDEMKNMCKVE